MGHTYSQKKNGNRYRYYVCRKAQKNGWDTCPTKSVSAPEIERFVVDRIRCIGEDPAVLAETVARTQGQTHGEIDRLEKEHRLLLTEIGRHEEEARGLISLTALNGIRFVSLPVVALDPILTRLKEIGLTPERTSMRGERRVAVVPAPGRARPFLEPFSSRRGWIPCPGKLTVCACDARGTCYNVDRFEAVAAEPVP